MVLTIGILDVETVIGQPAQKNIGFYPIVAGRSYTVEFSLDLRAGSWQNLAGFIQGDNLAVPTVTDLAAGPRKFYRVQISKP